MAIKPLKASSPRILFYDIETFPNVSYTWGKWEQNVLSFKEEWSLASVAYKWGSEKRVHCIARCDFPDTTDRTVVKKLHELFKSADVLVAHNGNSFDLKKMNARFLYHKLKPPKIPATIDTKLVAKRYFNLNSNSLNDIGVHLKLGEKVKHSGFDLWLGCMSGDKKSWALMKKYNRQDVVLLEKVYLEMKPWIQNHPNMGLLRHIKDGCPGCGGLEVYRRGIRANHRTLSQQWNCKTCGTWFLTPYKRAK